jgi:ribosomal protein S12 methylthiotransferase accessory factor
MMEHAEIKYEGGKKFLAENRGHKVVIDRATDPGETGQGPTPTELFIDGLGACVGMYVISYCKSAGINMEGLTIKVDWEKELKKKPYHIKNIDIKISLPNAEIGARKAALLKIAESCLIHQTIKGSPDIRVDMEAKLDSLPQSDYTG